MDVRVVSRDANQFVELRDLTPVEGGKTYKGSVRARLGGAQYRRPFWLDHEDLANFVREADWLTRSTSGRAELSGSAPTEGHLVLGRAREGWYFAGELPHFQDPDQHVRFRFDLEHSEVIHLLGSLRSLTASRAPLSED